jgi:hypothetical protein
MARFIVAGLTPIDLPGIQSQANGGGLTASLKKMNFINSGATTVAVAQNADTIDVTITSTDTITPTVLQTTSLISPSFPTPVVLAQTIDIPTGFLPMLLLNANERPGVQSSTGIAMRVPGPAILQCVHAIGSLPLTSGKVNFEGDINKSHAVIQMDTTRVRLQAPVAPAGSMKQISYVLGV